MLIFYLPVKLNRFQEDGLVFQETLLLEQFSTFSTSKGSAKLYYYSTYALQDTFKAIRMKLI